MYIFELVLNLFNKKKPTPQEFDFKTNQNFENSEEKCEHIFLPIDSTKKILACTKCGYIHKVTNQPKKNFFIK